MTDAGNENVVVTLLRLSIDYPSALSTVFIVWHVICNLIKLRLSLLIFF